MTTFEIPTNAKQLTVIVKQGESLAMEFKRSTGELKEGIVRKEQHQERLSVHKRAV